MNLDGAVVLVVGASGGLGSRIAAHLRAAGATVVRTGRTPARISGPGAYLADLRTPQGAESAVAAAVDAHGRLDGVVIAAGVVAFGPAAEVSDETLEELIEVNTLGPIRLLRAAVPHLLASAEAGREPFVVTLSGAVSERPTAGLAAYSASKAGLAAFVQAAGRELRRSGIRLLDARPGHTSTGLSTRALTGTAPAFGTGLDPDAVAARIVVALRDGERDLPSAAFEHGPR
ncbi:SDR family NAD(P)-dependent oxidoreductase [Actinotalea sp.]|uniref:SDR family NAD(P)-dependent oxidoreductase n=1 Tax=Actinotalea sp. TaxID=1872145 RepID=UPI00356B1B4F